MNEKGNNLTLSETSFSPGTHTTEPSTTEPSDRPRPRAETPKWSGSLALCDATRSGGGSLRPPASG